MSNTDRIRFSHMKTVVDRIKDWVDELYPITYNNSSKWFKWYPTMAKTKEVMDVASDMVTISPASNLSINSGTNKPQLYMDTEKIKLAPDNSGNAMELSDSTGISVSDSNGIAIGIDMDNDDIWGATIDSDGVLIKGIEDVDVKVGTTKLSLKDADLVFNDASNPNCSLIMGGVTPNVDANHPHTIYSASGDGVAHVVTKEGTKSITSGAYRQVNTITLSAGTWAISFGVHTDANVKDNEIMQVMVATGVDSNVGIYGGYHSSHAGAATRIGISGLGAYRVPDGTTKELPLKVQLSDSSIAVKYKITAVKIR